ncbi:sugar transporter-like protein [Xylariomycetidae sp. FL2044]|nr:sugar transporter-like protein [Xylariomycetidae sp. FL2044]
MATTVQVTTAQKVADQELEEKLGYNAILEAKQATEDEHSQTFMQALRENRRATFWSVLISMTIIMEGYDTILIGTFFAYPAFQHKFGEYYNDDVGWQVSGPWQTALNLGSTAGAVVGGLINGYAATKFGYRKVMIVALGILNAFIFIVFFAPNREVLLVGQILCGLSWGVFATLAPAYASEVCPTILRGYLTTYVNVCWAIGQLIAAGVLRGCLSIKGDMGYRIPFAVQWAWPVPLMVVCYLSPESPWWLVRTERLEEARHSIHRLSGQKTEEQMNNQLAMMVHTVKMEAESTKGATYADCFKGANLRRTEIVCVAFMGQILAGSSFAYTPTYFFTTAGMDTENAFNLSLGAKGMAFLGTICSWWLITYWGRRPIYVGGMGILTVILIIIGILDVSAGDEALWPQGGLCVFWLLVYSLTIGPLAYGIIAETSSVKLRPLSVVLARTSYQLINIVSQFLYSYSMNPTEWNWLGKSGFFWGGTAGLVFVWSYFRLPECKDRTYEELDILFENRVPAWKFATTHVDAYAAATVEESEEIHHKESH